MKTRSITRTMRRQTARSRIALSPAGSPEPVTIAVPVSSRADDLAAWCLLAIYCTLQLVLAVAHDPWLDEAQAWIWATTMGWPQQFFVLPAEGHPPLWYWLLRALSLVLDFNHARFITVPIAMLNAWLLFRLLRGQLLLLAMMLFSITVLHFWGYHFRPYGIVLLATLSALLLDRRGHPLAATWALALACGFHFFAGFLLAFFLVWQWKKGTPVASLLAPSLLALGFAGLAVLSGLGNVAIADPSAGAGRPPDVLTGTLSNLGWSAMLPALRQPVTALLTLALLVFGLRRQPLLLTTLLVLLIVFAIATSAVYGRSPWHFAFMTMLCFMAFTLTAPQSSPWVMPVLLAVPMVMGISTAIDRLQTPVWSQPDLYELIATDAGPGLDPARQLVSWPAMVGIAMAAVHKVSLLDGNDGSLLGPVDWRRWDPTRVWPGLLHMPRPYWVVCAECAPLLQALTAAGLKPSLLGQKFNPDNGDIVAYRID